MSDDHDFEPAYGLPEVLPANERLLWQGAPDWRALARKVMHLRMLSAYFAVLLLWQALSTWADGAAPLQALMSALFLLPLAALALGLLAALAWLSARSTVYTITDQRVVMRIGIVLSVVFNLPYRRIEGAALQRHKDGSGDISLTLAAGEHIAYLHLWPHARPWRISRTEPMLRCVPDADRVAALLAAALAASAGLARPAVAQDNEAPQRAPGRQALAA